VISYPQWFDYYMFFKGIFYFLFKGHYHLIKVIFSYGFCFFFVGQDQLTHQLLNWSFFLRLQASKSPPQPQVDLS
ncbi:hypothetical protein STEG23_025909, partial [Scotinomys teguina]